MNTNTTYLTKEGIKKVKTDLEYLENTKRKEIANRIQEAKELGDLSENAEYADAKNEQAANEGKVLDLKNVLKNAVIIKKTKSNGVVNIGSIITAEDENSNQKEYEIVGSQEANPSTGRISNESPIGNAFLGKKENDTVEFQAPKGIIKFKILQIK